MICPKCKKEINLPFEVDICPHCQFNLIDKNENLEDSVLSVSNPLSETAINYTILPKGSKFQDKYEIEEHITNIYPFSYYLVNSKETKYILQTISIQLADIQEIEKKINKEFSSLKENENEFNISIIEYGFKNGTAYFLLEYFPLETVEEILNTTGNLSEEYILNLILFLLNWYDNTTKPHIFLSPSNIINLGNNQFKVFNHKIFKIFVNFIKPFFFFKENISKYIAPELFKGNRLITKKADLYSIGKIWNTLINIDFIFTEHEDNMFKKQINGIISLITLSDYEQRIINKDTLKELIEEYLSSKSNNKFTTQKINLNEIQVFENDDIEEVEEVEEIKEHEEKIEHIEENIENEKDIELEEIEEVEDIEEHEEKIEHIEENIELEENIENEKDIEFVKEKIEDVEENEENIELEEIEEIEDIEEIDNKSLEEIEPEIIMKKITPPSIPIAPPSFKIKKITEKEYKIAKKQLNKNPIDLENLKTLYLYYSDKEMIDEAFVVSNLLNFMNDGSNSDLLFKFGKNVTWNFDKSILTDKNLEKILPKKIYFNTSGVMQALYNILENDLSLIKPIAPLLNYSTTVKEKEKLDIINDVIKLSGLKGLNITTTNQDIYNQKNVTSAIFKRDNSLNLMIRKDLLKDIEKTQLKVLISKLVFLTHPHIVGNFIYDVPTIKDIFYGAMKFVIPSSRNMYNSKISNILFKELENQKSQKKLKRTDVIRLVMLMNEHLYNRKSQPNIDESMKLIEIASDRFALIASNNLNATLKTFLNYENVNISLSATERMKALLKYVLSEDYFQLRKDINQSVKA